MSEGLGSLCHFPYISQFRIAAALALTSNLLGSSHQNKAATNNLVCPERKTGRGVRSACGQTKRQCRWPSQGGLNCLSHKSRPNITKLTTLQFLMDLLLLLLMVRVSCCEHMRSSMIQLDFLHLLCHTQRMTRLDKAGSRQPLTMASRKP